MLIGFFAERARGVAKVAAEQRGEILAGGKTAVEGHVQNATRRVVSQELGRQLQAAAVEILDGRDIGELFGVVNEVGDAQAALPGHAGHGLWFGKVFAMLAQVGPVQRHRALGAGLSARGLNPLRGCTIPRTGDSTSL